MIARYVVILACGSGTRMQSEMPKQYLLLGDKPIIFHTIENIWQIDATYNMIVVINEEHLELFNNLKRQYAVSTPFKLVFGGKERYFSVKNALDTIQVEDSLVAIHDGVRPFVDKDMFERSFISAMMYGNGICAVKSTDSIRVGDMDTNYAVDRREVFMMQTPQTFLTKMIKRAYLQDYDMKFTDDASVAESMGQNIHIVEGKRENIKITYPFDLFIAEKILVNLRNE